MNHFEELDLDGILLRIGGTVEGYAYGSVLPGGAFDVMVLKGNLDFRIVCGEPFCASSRATCVDKATYLNLEEDLGLPGLREKQAELPALRPHGKVPRPLALALPQQKNCARSVNRRANRRVAVRASSPDADSSPAFGRARCRNFFVEAVR